MFVYHVYIITNLVNGKQYVGVTKHTSLQRFKRHCKSKSVIGQAIRKYGSENFSIGTVDQQFSTKKEADQLEIKLIELFRTRTSPHGQGYNVALGGQGPTGCDQPRSPEWNEKVCQSKLGSRNPMYGKPSPMRGKKHTEESNQKNRLAHLGKKCSDETRLKNSLVSRRSWGDPQQYTKRCQSAKNSWLNEDRRINISNKLKNRQKLCSICKEPGHNKKTCGHL